MPQWRGNRAGAKDTFSERLEDGRIVIAVEQKQLADPLTLVAALAREIGRSIVFERHLVQADSAEVEPLGDLMTVFRGLGVFTANTAFDFTQYAGGGRQGWSVRRRGSLSEETLGYALAYYARLRGEANPRWVRHLKPNVAQFFKQSTRYLGNRRR
ncbi:MAG TPA: hypothetical protein VFW40_03700 [Capsulimonadaceae bacterium]|nr:hypothetical protein [Capsulimonadaceae bacterium]